MNQQLQQLFGRIGDRAGQVAGNWTVGYCEKLERHLTSAGMSGELKANELLGIQVVTAAIFPVFWGFVLARLHFVDFLFEGPKQVLVYGLLFLGGFLLPARFIKDKAGRRRMTIALTLPNTLDLLTISVEAGLDFMTALKRVVEKQHPGPLREEMERFMKQIDLGKDRLAALREMADRVQLQDLSSVVSALIQAFRFGASIGPILTAQSDMLRIRRAQRAEKSAQEAPVKMLMPLMGCIMPAVFIMIMVPLFIKMFIDLNR